MGNRKQVIIFLSLIFMLLLFEPVLAASVNATRFKKYFTYFDRARCGGLWVNRAVIQDKRGVMYFGGDGGLREYDGVSWRTIPVPGNWVSALAIDPDGVLYIGGNNEIGYLAPDTYGSLHYKSLVHLIDPDRREFTILNVHAQKEGVYFNAGIFLFRWDPHSGESQVWEPENEFGLSFTLREDRVLYIQDLNAGVKRIENRTLHPVPGFEDITSETICVFDSLLPGRILVGTRSGHLYIHHRDKTVPFPTEARDFLKGKRLINGIRLASGDFALSTFFGGVVVIRPDGSTIEIFNESFGLPDDLVNYIFEDVQGNLWLALDMGIVKVERLSPISTYHSPPVQVFSIINHRDLPYFSAKEGLYLLSPRGEFQQVPGSPTHCRSLLSTGDSLLVSTDRGVFEVGREKTVKIIDNNTFTLLQSRLDKNRVWVQSVFAFFSLYRDNRKWVKEYEFEKKQLIHTVAEDKDGNLWLGDSNIGEALPPKGFFKVNLSDRVFLSSPPVNSYHISGSIFSNANHVFRAGDHIVFSNSEGIFRFQENKNIFIPELRFGKELEALTREKEVHNLVEDNKKNIWVLFYDNTAVRVVYQPDGTYLLDQEPFRRIPPQIELTGIYPDTNNHITWLYGPSVIIRFDTAVKKNYRAHFPTLIRKVTVNGHPVFMGYKTNEGNNPIPYGNRKLCFEFAAPFYEGEFATQYRYRLQGHEEGWSAWTPETSIEYTGLEPGDYRFRVQAKNVFDHYGSEAVFSFNILLPWYRTWWAFLFYAAVLSMIVYLFMKSRRTIQLEREKQKLEKIVNERTEEINLKNRQLEQQTLRLKEQSEKLKEMDKIKSRFFANISHEFRTPLALIMGPLRQMLDSEKENRDKSDHKKKLDLMLRNSQRLLRLIDRLLQLSKLESGTVKLHVYQQNIVPFLKGIAASFEAITAQNEQTLSVLPDRDNIPLYFDPWKIEEVFFNLLSNAVKFTPPRGKITVTVQTLLHSVCISVRDTGPGIPPGQLAFIFDRFYQADSTYEHYKKGSGIGLAIAKELVELHHGKIEARNSEGGGAEFIITIPHGDQHFKPHQLSEPVENLYQPSPRSYLPEFSPAPEEIPPGPPPVVLRENSGDIVLVVEDSADFREYMKGALETFYTVVTAENGAEGIRKANEIIPDLIISDIIMPEADGYRLCSELKSKRETAHIPIILLTARASEESIVRGLDTGADDYITKPFNSKILIARIKNLIDRRRALQVERRRKMAVKPREIDVPSVDETFIRELEDVIEANLSDPEFNVEQLKKKMVMGRTTLYRKITALTGLSPNRFIRTYRMKRAAQLLEANFGNISKVALEVGFTNMAYFSQCFKEEFDQSPSGFLASVSGGNS